MVQERWPKKSMDPLQSSVPSHILCMNRVAGYCVPQHISDVTVPLPPSSAVITDGGSGSTAPAPSSSSHSSSSRESAPWMERQKDESNILSSALASDIRMDIISSIACYCDIQFSNKEYLTVLKYPDHPFAKQFGLPCPKP